MRSVWKNFIVLEGLDGAGTTTQRDLLIQRLREIPVGACSTCEPTNGPIGQVIRRALRHEIVLEPDTLARLLAADRQEHLFGHGGIQEEIHRGNLVVADRYYFSSLAYQTVDTPYPQVALYNQTFPLPQVLFYIDVPLEECRRRREERWQKQGKSTGQGEMRAELFEYDDFLKRAADNYERAFNEIPADRILFRRIQGTGNPREIHEELWRTVKDLPILKGR